MDSELVRLGLETSRKDPGRCCQRTAAKHGAMGRWGRKKGRQQRRARKAQQRLKHEVHSAGGEPHGRARIGRKRMLLGEEGRELLPDLLQFEQQRHGQYLSKFWWQLGPRPQWFR